MPGATGAASPGIIQPASPNLCSSESGPTGRRSRPRRWTKVAAKRLAEPLPGGALPLPIDYKTYVFGASRPMSRPISDAAAGTGGSSMTIAGGSSSGPRTNRRPPPPLAAMLEAAETLAGDMNCLRGDFYDVGDRPYFGDYRLYPGSGLAPVAADWIDFELGALRLAAIPPTRRRPVIGRDRYRNCVRGVSCDRRSRKRRPLTSRSG